jgi:hypothetical protein
MDILLIAATLVVAAAGLYVAFTFNRRTRANFAPLIDDAINDVIGHIDAIAEDLRARIKVIADDLQRDREQGGLETRKIQGRLDYADSRMTTIASQISTELDTIRRLVDPQDARPGSAEATSENHERTSDWWEPPPRPRDPDLG